MKKALAIIMSALIMAGLLAGVASAEKPRPTHTDRAYVADGCVACHKGRGVPGTPLLQAKGERLCFKCHGQQSRGLSSTDIESQFLKKSTHPIYDTAQYHWFGETLPEENPSTPRHVACPDCHVVHASEPKKPWKGARGYEPAATRARGMFGGPPPGRRLMSADEEYQMCYLCHADSANLPKDATNKAVEFDPTNPSYHPVEAAGRNSKVPSLVRDLSVTSRIRCTSCHGSSNVRDPKGVHGSDFAPILVAKYRTDGGPEGPTVYALCYMCHDRRSILRDDSFKRHNLHIVNKRASCFACHDAHGSADYKHLIKFDPDVVGASPVSKGPKYISASGGKPTCYLKCHDTDHNSSGVGGKTWPW